MSRPPCPTIHLGLLWQCEDQRATSTYPLNWWLAPLLVSSVTKMPSTLMQCYTYYLWGVRSARGGRGANKSSMTYGEGVKGRKSLAGNQQWKGKWSHVLREIRLIVNNLEGTTACCNLISSERRLTSSGDWKSIVYATPRFISVIKANHHINKDYAQLARASPQVIRMYLFSKSQ